MDDATSHHCVLVRVQDSAYAEITGCRKAVRLIEELGVRVMYDATDENAEEEWNMRQAADEYDELMDEINYHKADAKKWAEQAMQLWQPIETAPKDGRYLMVGNEDGVWIASYCATFQSGFKPDNPWISLMLNHRHIEKVKRNYSRVPTHWMPLPRSPKVDGSNAAIPNVNFRGERSESAAKEGSGS